MQNKALQTLIDLERQLSAELESVQAAIALLKGIKEEDESESGLPKTGKGRVLEGDYSGYSGSWPIAKKFIFFLKKENRFLHVKEVAEKIGLLENVTDLKKLASSISSGTYGIKQQGILVKYQIKNQNKNTFWGFPEWMDKDGRIKKGYEYNKEYLSKAGRSAGDLFDFGE